MMGCGFRGPPTWVDDVSVVRWAIQQNLGRPEVEDACFSSVCTCAGRSEPSTRRHASAEQGSWVTQPPEQARSRPHLLESLHCLVTIPINVRLAQIRTDDAAIVSCVSSGHPTWARHSERTRRSRCARDALLNGGSVPPRHPVSGRLADNEPNWTEDARSGCGGARTASHGRPCPAMRWRPAPAMIDKSTHATLTLSMRSPWRARGSFGSSARHGITHRCAGPVRSDPRGKCGGVGRAAPNRELGCTNIRPLA